ncbi:hypothetical protein [Thiothrix subterranea]|uniref:Uncharacterized protein n=1 Tax=Thiothrix subterranea TaxID=2735563 RepID=A0AA51R365_9GAMM|nr:hypothetical protein [Thiothrix subterranea]MDQ5767485.1 hypothetical protein [Thiothrix subterranea]WML88644.1 hypothetical protein RCG00_09745 [Thiothrix subterranea]
MSETIPLHSSIVALVSLAAGIAAKHPSMGLCQVQRLRSLGVSEDHIQTAVEIARHIRDEAAQKLDTAFDEQFSGAPVVEAGGACCTPTASGQACC